GGVLGGPGVGGGMETAARGVGGLLLVSLAPQLRARHAVLLLLLLIASFVAAGVTLYLRRSILLDGATPSLALGVLFTVMLAVTLADAETQRRVLRRQVERQREAAARLAGEPEAGPRIPLGTLAPPATALSWGARVG